jgi:hypothetical protein
MKNPLWVASVISVLFSAIAFPAESKEISIGDWSHTAALELGSGTQRRVVEFSLTPEVLDMVRPEFQDLRVVARPSEEIGFVIKSAKDEVREVPLDARLYDRTFVPGRQSSVIADFGSRVLKNRIMVRTPGSNFRRKVRVEGSDDGESWAVVRDGAFLFQISEPSAQASHDLKVIRLPDNAQRFLRVTVFNGPDDPDHVPIDGVSAWRRRESFGETEPVRVRILGTDQKKRTTEMALDLGYRHMPLYELELTVRDSNFLRGVTVLGRNSLEQTVRRPVEDSSAHERKIETPWIPVVNGVIYRYSAEGQVEESLRVSLVGAGYRYLLVRIQNGDNSPLDVSGLSVRRATVKVAFPERGTEGYALYVGNPSAARPEYDVGHYLDRLRGDGVQMASLGGLMPNPAYGPRERVLPWSERHRSVIWVALLAMVAALGFLVYRMVRSTGVGRSPDG